MVDPTTVNTSLAIPIRGTDVGTWDLPANGNFTAIDSMFGGVTTVALSSQNVTLLSSQGQSAVIRLTGTLLANIGIILPSIYKSWIIDNQITNSPSSFSVGLISTDLAKSIGCPPGSNGVYYDGSTTKYIGLGKLGEYWDYAGTTVPTWATATQNTPVLPYLNCNGTTFSSATYPQLANLLGTTTLPDSRGRVRIVLNQGTARTTVLNADIIFTGGGDQNLQAHNHTGSGTTSGTSVDHTHAGSGTTSSANADHTHGGSGTTSGVSVDHTHTILPAGIAGLYTAAGGAGNFASGPYATSGISTGGASADHSHTYSFTTGGMSATHQHTYSFTSTGQSADHSHTYSFTTSTAGSGGSLNIQPSYVGGITMIRAA